MTSDDRAVFATRSSRSRRGPASVGSRLGRQDSNLRMSAPKTDALPLGRRPSDAGYKRSLGWLSTCDGSRVSHFSSRAAMVAVLFAAACSPGVAEPERALAQFLGHVQRGRADDAWNALTAESQSQLRAQAATLAEAAGQPPTDDVDEILFDQLRLRAPAKPDTIVVVGPLGERVRLRVSMPDDARSAELWMVKEDGRWKVDLVGSLIARAPEAGADRASTPAPPIGRISRHRASPTTPTRPSISRRTPMPATEPRRPHRRHRPTAGPIPTPLTPTGRRAAREPSVRPGSGRRRR